MRTKDPKPTQTAKPTQTQSSTEDQERTPVFAYVLQIVRILIDYGTHLVDNFPRIAAHPNFPNLACEFASQDRTYIRNLLWRGVLRALMLEKYLKAQASHGKDLEPTPVHNLADPETIARLKLEAGPPRVPNTRQRGFSEHFSRPNTDNPASFAHPTNEELEAWVRSRSLSRALADIKLDMGLSAMTTLPEVFRRATDIMMHFGKGNGAFCDGYLHWCAVHGRRRRLVDESTYYNQGDWRHHDWREVTRSVREMLGFLCGEPPPKS